MERLLNANPALIQATDESLGWGALHYAADHELAVEFLLSRGADPGIQAHGGETPLHLASNYATMKLLIAAGADPEAKDSDGLSPLGLAYTERDWKGLRILAGPRYKHH